MAVKKPFLTEGHKDKRLRYVNCGTTGLKIGFTINVSVNGCLSFLTDATGRNTGELNR